MHCLTNFAPSGLAVSLLLLSGCGSSGSGHPVEDTITRVMQQDLNQYRQIVFNGIHPVGTAKSVVVHDVEVQWKGGQPTNRLQDVQAFAIRFTLYWEGPIEKNGFTKAYAIFDAESRRWVGGQILATNGITNSQTFELGAQILGTYLNENGY